MRELITFTQVLISVTFATVIFSGFFGGLLFLIDYALGQGTTLGTYQLYTLPCAGVIIIVRLIKTSWFLDINL